MKNKKGNTWPLAIFIFYGLFVAGLLMAVFITISNNVEMETSNYYEKTLVYEDQITRIKNANALKDKPQINFEKNKSILVLTMPQISGNIDFRGNVHLFRPSNSKLDRYFELKMNNLGQQFIPLQNLAKGKWEVRIQWTDGHKEYYFEQRIYI